MTPAATALRRWAELIVTVAALAAISLLPNWTRNRDRITDARAIRDVIGLWPPGHDDEHIFGLLHGAYLTVDYDSNRHRLAGHDLARRGAIQRNTRMLEQKLLHRTPRRKALLKKLACVARRKNDGGSAAAGNDGIVP